MASELGASLKEYPKALGRYWEVLVIGAIPTLLGLLQDVLGIKVPPMIWLWALAGGVMVAQFLAWHRMRVERNQLRRYDVAQGTLTALTEFRGRLVGLQNEAIPNETHLGGWKERYSQLRGQIMDFIRTNISPAECNLFETLGDYELVGLAGKDYRNMDHFNFTSRIIRDRRWLEKMVQDYGRQRFRPELVAQEEKNGE